MNWMRKKLFKSTLPCSTSSSSTLSHRTHSAALLGHRIWVICALFMAAHFKPATNWQPHSTSTRRHTATQFTGTLQSITVMYKYQQVLDTLAFSSRYFRNNVWGRCQCAELWWICLTQHHFRADFGLSLHFQSDCREGSYPPPPAQRPLEANYNNNTVCIKTTLWTYTIFPDLCCCTMQMFARKINTNSHFTLTVYLDSP